MTGPASRCGVRLSEHHRCSGFRSLLLIGEVQVADIPDPEECGRGAAEDVADGDDAFTQCGMDQSEVSAVIACAEC